jgi:N-acetylmuramoyl-L-alanine amidase
MHFTNKFIASLTKAKAAIFCLALLLFSTPLFSNSPEAYRLRKVVIDAGHGGKDPGAIGKLGFEKDIVLSVALKLGKYIEQSYPDVEVLYTRKEDVFVGVAERSKFANEKGADLFISIHCNANPNKSPYGAETYVMGLHKSNENLDVAMRENAVITYEEDYSTKYEGYDPNSAESFIIFSLMQHSFLEHSLNFASSIQTEFKEKALRKDRGVKQAGFLVLWRTTMPSVLVELGFISHPKEEEFLLSDQGQDYLASALYRAFKDHKTNIESRSTLIAESPSSEPKQKAETAKEKPSSSKPTSTISNTQTPSVPKQNAGVIKPKVEAAGKVDDTTEKTSGKKPSSTINNPQASNVSKQNAEVIKPKVDATEKANSSTQVAFRVQITSSNNPIPKNSGFFKKVDGIEEIPIDGLYKYYIGIKQNYSEIVDYSNQVKELFPDAFIVAFMNGKQIPMDQAIKLTSQ